MLSAGVISGYLTSRLRSRLGLCEHSNHKWQTSLLYELTLETKKGIHGAMAILRILLIEDFEPFRRMVGMVMQERADFRIVGEASDGLEAVQKVKDLQPDLILLDIGLPNLHGFEVAKLARSLAPHAKLLFVSQESSTDTVREAFRLGAEGYVHKLQAHNELLPAIDAIFAGKRFVSSSLKFTEANAAHSHEVVFCSSDGVLLDVLASFIASALNGGDAAIVLIAPSHHDRLRQKLKIQGVDVDAAIEQGTLVSWNVRDALSTFMVDDWPDASRLATVLNDLIRRAAQGPAGGRRRVVTCGECAPALWAEGKIEAAIHVEHLWDEATKARGVNTLCVYPSHPGQGDDHSFKRLCAEHTAVCSQ
jgi:AmiR/NasT family two-component response regulator